MPYTWCICASSIKYAYLYIFPIITATAAARSFHSSICYLFMHGRRASGTLLYIRAPFCIKTEHAQILVKVGLRTRRFDWNQCCINIDFQYLSCCLRSKIPDTKGVFDSAMMILIVNPLNPSNMELHYYITDLCPTTKLDTKHNRLLSKGMYLIWALVHYVTKGSCICHHKHIWNTRIENGTSYSLWILRMIRNVDFMLVWYNLNTESSQNENHDIK